MRVALVLVFVPIATGCGRVAFDEHGDARTVDGTVDVALEGHDEDLDGWPDSLDNCPHLANPAQDDADGDRVGDDCDPNPLLAIDEIVLFDPFVELLPAWTVRNGVPSFDGESLTADLRAGVLRLDMPATFSTARIEVAGAIGEARVGIRQMAISARETPPSFYCELYESTFAKLALSYTLDNVVFEPLIEAPATMAIENGNFRLQLEGKQAVSYAACETSWPVTAARIGGTVPGNIQPTVISLYATGVVMRWDYFIYIRTNE